MPPADPGAACSASACEPVSRFRRLRTEENRAAREADVRQRSDVLDYVGESLQRGLARSTALRCAAISSGTWRNWQRWRHAGNLPLASRGRPPRCASRSERQQAIGFLVEHGAQVPLWALCEHVPTVPRAELADLRRRYQHVVHWRRDRFRGRLLWKRVGAVWSMDFTEPKEYIGGTDRWILAIRDLASGYQLAWLSFAQATAECVVQTLSELFAEHGPPLVLKSDNGSQFIAEATLHLLCQWKVEPLFNPPRRPAYNGGLERTHPILKSYTEAAAAAHGRPTGILPEDLRTGRANANRFTRRFGDDGPTAAEAWLSRAPISENLRVAFRQSIELRRPAARAARGLPDDAALNHYQRAAIDREAIRDALLEYDLLEIGPRRGQRTLAPAAPTDYGGPPCAVASVETAPVAPPPPPCPAAVDNGADEAHLDDPNAAAGLAPSLPSEPSAVDGERDAVKICCAPAPPREESCTISQASASLSDLGNDRPPSAPAHGEPAATNPLRRFITPLITWLRRAKIRQVAQQTIESSNSDKKAMRRIRWRQFGIKTLFWLVACAACALFGFTAGQRYEQMHLSDGWKQLNAEAATRWSAIDRAQANVKIMRHEVYTQGELAKQAIEARKQVKQRIEEAEEQAKQRMEEFKERVKQIDEANERGIHKIGR